MRRRRLIDFRPSVIIKMMVLKTCDLERDVELVKDGPEVVVDMPVRLAMYLVPANIQGERLSIIGIHARRKLELLVEGEVGNRHIEYTARLEHANPMSERQWHIGEVLKAVAGIHEIIHLTLDAGESMCIPMLTIPCIDVTVGNL